MHTWLTNWWNAFSTGFWFVPGLFLLGGLVLGIIAPELDAWYQDRIGGVPPVLETTGTTARATLTALCGAMFTVTGLVFSTTTVALSITANQLGPRLLRNFLGQLVTQVTLGVCLASSVYCLVLLRRIDKLDGTLFVPHGSLMLASGLGLLTLMMVIYFTHRVVHSMQAQNVVSDVADDVDDAVERLFPERIGARARASDGVDDWESVWHSFDESDHDSVESASDGYLQAIDDDTLLRIACENDLSIRVRSRPGDYLRENDALLDVVPSGRLDEEQSCRLERLFLRGNARTTQQDVECAVNELVEIALRALSPGVNDPFTAIACIDRLSGALRRLAKRQPASGLRADEDGTQRLVVRPRTFGSVVDAAFNQLRQHSKGDVAVTVRLLDALTAIARDAERRPDRDALSEQAEMIMSSAQEQALPRRDLDDIEAQHQSFTDALTATTADP